jgi:hypothetical protein
MVMAKSSKDLELRPDGWERFDRAVTAAVKSGPKHRVGEKKLKPRKRKKAMETAGK